MRLEKCPRCNSAVQKTDQVCVSCGLDLLEAERKLTANAADAARGEKRPQNNRPSAASGVATDVGQDTRLHVYDQIYAEKLQKEKQATMITAVVAAGVGIIFLGTAMVFLGHAGGFGGMIHSLTPATMRGEGLGALGDNGFLAGVFLGLGLAGILTGVGQMQRVKLMVDAIEDVKFGGRPTVVAIPAATSYGMILASFLFPPFGIVLGIIFKLSDDSDTRDLGTRMLLAGVAAIALFVINWLWGLAAHLKDVAPREKSVPEG